MGEDDGTGKHATRDASNESLKRRLKARLSDVPTERPVTHQLRLHSNCHSFTKHKLSNSKREQILGMFYTNVSSHGVFGILFMPIVVPTHLG